MGSFCYSLAENWNILDFDSSMEVATNKPVAVLQIERCLCQEMLWDSCKEVESVS